MGLRWRVGEVDLGRALCSYLVIGLMGEVVSFLNAIFDLERDSRRSAMWA